jgi:hypothetical protein
MSTWVLILFAHVGAMGTGNSNAITTAEFTNERNCMVAGAAAKKLAAGAVKFIDFACVPK